jgi:hypothetical protein
MDSCLIRINLRNKAEYLNIKNEWIPVTILDMVLVPNGMDDPKLVCAIYAQKEDGGMVNATSDKFRPLEGEKYEEFYPTSHMFKVNSIEK